MPNLSFLLVLLVAASVAEAAAADALPGIVHGWNSAFSVHLHVHGTAVHE